LKTLLIAVVVGASFAAVAVCLPALGRLSPNHAIAFLQRMAVYSALPGLLLGYAIAGNVHTFSAGAAGLGSFLFYFFLCWGVGQMVMWLLRRRVL
jgi:hypothetical protein